MLKQIQSSMVCMQGCVCPSVCVCVCVCAQVDVVGKRNHILAVPMLSLALHWSANLKGNPLAAPLTTLLADCRLRLQTHFAQFIMDRVIC